MSLIGKLFAAGAAKGDALRDEGLATPEDIVRFDNISYGPCGDENLLDVYRQKSATAPMPVIISIHGGGYVYGTKETYQFYCMNLAQHGFSVVNFNYRLAPKTKFPAPLEDTCRVLSWMLKNNEEYLLDMNNVFIVGDSAGAQLCSQMGALLSNKEYAALFDFDVPEINLRAIAINCGHIELKGKSTGLLKGLNRDYFGKLNVEADPRCDVVANITDKYPPAIVMGATGDPLITGVDRDTAILKSKGVEVVETIYGDPEKKELSHVFHIDQKLDAAHECNDFQCEFFKKHIV